MTLKDIQQYLEVHYGEKRTRHTLTQDIEALKALGFDIRESSKQHNQYVYQLVDREFTFDEIRILVDSICVNQFLTWCQKKQIINKFKSIISTRDVERLKSTIKINDYINEDINLLDNINCLHTALLESKTIHFKYGRYNARKQFILKDKAYYVIPKEIVYKESRYYLIALAINENFKIKHYRIDRMMDLEIGKEHDDHSQINMENFDLRTFDMFTGDKMEMVTLRVHEKLIDLMIERFGKQVSMRPDFESKEYVIVHQEVSISIGFIRWLLNQGSMIEVLAIYF